MSLILITKFLISIVVGMLAIPIGILPSIFLFRDLANGTDASESAKSHYAWILWGGMAVAWVLGSAAIWYISGVIHF